MKFNKYDKKVAEEIFDSLCKSHDYLIYSNRFINEINAYKAIDAIRDILKDLVHDFPFLALRTHDCYNHDWYDEGYCNICGKEVSVDLPPF